MLSYRNDQTVKDKYVNRMQAHIDADELIQGIGWSEKENKGCAIGCTLNNYNHEAYERELGLPSWFAYLEDYFFENASLKYSKNFPVRFLKAIKIGMSVDNFNTIQRNFMDFINSEAKEAVKDAKENAEVTGNTVEEIEELEAVVKDAKENAEIIENLGAFIENENVELPWILIATKRTLEIISKIHGVYIAKKNTEFYANKFIELLVC